MATAPTSPEETKAGHAELTRVERRPRYGQPFFPAVPFGSAFYILATVIALVILAVSSPAPLQNPADPLNHEQISPRPEWYFLFLFQILKVFQGPWEVVGTAVIPGVIGLILLGLPFYDRNWSRRAVRRPVAVSLASLSIIGLALLTYIPIAGTAQPTMGGALLATVSAHPTWSNVEAIFVKSCSGCHVGVSTYFAGLNLSTYDGTMKGGTGPTAVVQGAVIKPGNAQGSYLWQVVAWRPDLYRKIDGGKGANMPLGRPQISKVDQQNIANWINDGAKNNG